MAKNYRLLWQFDKQLEKTLNELCRKKISKKNMLDLLKKDFPMYSWNIRGIYRRIKYFSDEHQKPMRLRNSKVRYNINQAAVLHIL